MTFPEDCRILRGGRTPFSCRYPPYPSLYESVHSRTAGGLLEPDRGSARCYCFPGRHCRRLHPLHQRLRQE
nr:MAG TPA: hypothetical protein [Caudoviricetes sp.]